MEILCLSVSYIPSQWANSVHVMQMCHGFARAGHHVTLVAKRAVAAGGQDDYAFYGVEPIFRVIKLRRPGLPGGSFAYVFGMWRTLRRVRPHLVYAIDPVGAWLSTRMGYPTVLEAHQIFAGRFQRWILHSVLRARALRRVVAISEGLRKELVDHWISAATDIVLARVAAAPLAKADGQSIGREEEDTQRARVGYVGSINRGRGLALIVDLAHRIPECDFHIVGATAHQVAEQANQALAGNLLCHGFVPHGQLAPYFHRMDILLLPMQSATYGPGGSENTAPWASPQKLFEYMAAGLPIVASDVPAVREVLRDGDNALLAPPEDHAAWERAIRTLVADPGRARLLGCVAQKEWLENYTWERRAKRVLAGL